MVNYAKVSISDEPRTGFHDQLGLTGAEISVNNFPAGANVPVIHSHKENEEIYSILSGNGKMIVDDDEIELAAGDIYALPRKAKTNLCREDADLSYACIQVKSESLDAYTADDAVMHE